MSRLSEGGSGARGGYTQGWVAGIYMSVLHDAEITTCRISEQCKQIQAQLEAMRSSVAIKAGGRKGQKAGLKRAGSERELLRYPNNVSGPVLMSTSITSVPQPTSPAPSNDSPRKPGTAKRQKIEKAESIASTDDYPHPLAGTVDPESGRLYQESGKLETKKQHEKRMVEERRLQREQSKQTKNTKGERDDDTANIDTILTDLTQSRRRVNQGVQSRYPLRCRHREQQLATLQTKTRVQSASQQRQRVGTRSFTLVQRLPTHSQG